MNPILSNSERYLNYTASIQRINRIEEIPGVKKLVYARIGMLDILVTRDFHEGDCVVFVPCETVLSSKYLKINNLYRNAWMNSNKSEYFAVVNSKSLTDEEKSVKMRSMTGYFDVNGRVTIKKIKGNYSPGFIAKTETIEKAYPITKDLVWSAYLGLHFDTINGEVFCSKYIPDDPKANKLSKKIQNPSFDYLIPENFPPHYVTRPLYDCIDKLTPESVVDITVKVSGASMIIGNIPCNRHLDFIDKIKRFFSIKNDETIYKCLYSSRKTVQNRYDDQIPCQPYESVYELMKHHISRDMIVYGEICGYFPGTNNCILKHHDYGCNVGEYKFMPYRIITRNNDGTFKEWSVFDVISWTIMTKTSMPSDKAKFLMPMQEVFCGKLENIIPFIKQEGCNADENLYHWRRALYKSLMNMYGMGHDEPLCKNTIPREGLVFRIVGDDVAEAFKLKSEAHYMIEKKAHDNNDLDIEESY